jgi:hypothetical protein
MKEIAGREPKSPLKERGEYHNLIGVGMSYPETSRTVARRDLGESDSQLV